MSCSCIFKKNKGMSKEDVINRLQLLKPFLKERYGLTELALFGSYSRSEQTGESDIDIMVDFNKSVGIEFLDVVYLLRNEFAGMVVQVVPKKGIKASYFQRLQQDLVYA
jgi:uncharacterized protein